MKMTLNIGLAREGKPNLTTDEVLDALKTAGLLVGQNTIVQSDTEPTLVVSCFAQPHLMTVYMAQVYMVAADLDQDCIAVYWPETNSGALVGPRAAAWGAFDARFFFTLDGNRLA